MSWLVIEPGWSVRSADGEEIGRVEDVVGDREADIFGGLAVRLGLLGAPRYVDADRVRSIAQRSVELDLSAEQAKGLPPHDPPPSLRIVAD